MIDVCNRNQDQEELQKRSQAEVDKMMQSANRTGWLPIRQAQDTHEDAKEAMERVIKEGYGSATAEDMGLWWRAVYALEWALKELERRNG